MCPSVMAFKRGTAACVPCGLTLRMSFGDRANRAWRAVAQHHAGLRGEGFVKLGGAVGPIAPPPHARRPATASRSGAAMCEIVARVRHCTLLRGTKCLRVGCGQTLCCGYPSGHGLCSSTPNCEKSLVLRVTTVSLRMMAVAAIMASSLTVSDLRCIKRAHSRKAGASIGKTP